MCDVMTAVAVGSAAIQAGSALVDHEGQRTQKRANDRAANSAEREGIRALDLRRVQEIMAADEEIAGADQQVASAAALARVAAGEAGVAGASVDAVLRDIELDGANFEVLTRKNLGMTLDQIEQEKRGVRATATARREAVAPPSVFTTGLRITGAGLDFATSRINRKP